MTEYWVSTAKHYCQACKKWISGHQRSILMHNMSKQHLENEALLLQESDRKQKEKKKKEAEEDEIIRMMNAGADKAMGIQQVCPDAGTEGQASSSSRGQGSSAQEVRQRLLEKQQEAQRKAQEEEDNQRKQQEAELQSSIKQKRLQLVRQLKKDWVVCEDINNKEITYYFNKRTMKRQIERPKGIDDEVIDINDPESQPFDETPRLWVDLEDKNSQQNSSTGQGPSKYYWYNTQTGETQWEKPQQVIDLERAQTADYLKQGFTLVDDKDEGVVSYFAKKRERKNLEEEDEEENEGKRHKSSQPLALQNSSTNDDPSETLKEIENAGLVPTKQSIMASVNTLKLDQKQQGLEDGVFVRKAKFNINNSTGSGAASAASNSNIGTSSLFGRRGGAGTIRGGRNVRKRNTEDDSD